MNEKFYCLPEEKQQRIINAGFLVFSDTSYRRAPVSDVAGGWNQQSIAVPLF